MWSDVDKENLGYRNNQHQSSTIRKDSETTVTKKKKRGKKRRSVLKAGQEVTSARTNIFSPIIHKNQLFSPDTFSKSSMRSKIELQNVLKEAQAFLNEPDIKYEPNNNQEIYLKN
jgi:hypothetical protein